MNSFKMLGSVVVCSALCFAALNANTISKSDADLLFSNVDTKESSSY